ncbi:CoA-binding protein [Aliifodinibius sp. S!AR15-10]|uniref:CoA-binding protein n=1 Tax=Aliifodinibius sp. S!AR15-10 TaxID=2950437 RepID=UPI002863223E|nr:CoA-binding protein [Aliifodinibius sp. S!AR15-10]MDR8393863.1 CoA-binding protein [Aliifodinibius sp. S!AR15-10]
MKSTFDNWYEKKMRANPEISAETDRAGELLDQIDTIAIVGISRDRHRDSHFVGRYLKKAGYTIIPVNPGADEILGEKAYPELRSIPAEIDVVDIFRPPEVIPEAVEEALEVNPKAIWLQLGTGTHNELKEKVEKNGIHFFQNRCMKVDHQFLIRPKKEQREKTVS